MGTITIRIFITNIIRTILITTHILIPITDICILIRILIRIRIMGTIGIKESGTTKTKRPDNAACVVRSLCLLESGENRAFILVFNELFHFGSR